MPRPSALPADRFFARVDRFLMECPACGELVGVWVAGATSTADRRRQLRRARQALRPGTRASLTDTYNPLTSRLTCPQCRKVWAIGLVAYPVALRVMARQPADQKPTLAQLLDLRRRAGGWLSDRMIAGADEVNQGVVAECTCPEGVGGLDMGCPIHGRYRGAKTRSEE